MTEPRNDRFAYELAEEALDAFASTHSSVQYQRAWRLTKLWLYLLARTDHMPRGIARDEALAFAWEDLQMAFVGHGEPSLTGAVLQLWSNVKGAAARRRFARVIGAAFKRAEAGTSSQVPRRYLRSYRNKDPRTPDQGFQVQAILPVSGPRATQWSEDQSFDATETLENVFWLEQADRFIRAQEEARLAANRPGPRLVPMLEDVE